MSKSIYICKSCNKDISDKARYRVYVRKFTYYKEQALLSTMDLCHKCYKSLNIEVVEKEKKEKPKIVEPQKRTFIFNPIMKTIADIEWFSSVKLSDFESRLVSVLANENMNTWEDINKYIYQDDKKHNKFAAGNVKTQLVNKVPLNIRVIHNGGLVLDDKILIDV